MKSWGGTALAIPFLVERSTTSLVERIRNREPRTVGLALTCDLRCTIRLL